VPGSSRPVGDRGGRHLHSLEPASPQELARTVQAKIQMSTRTDYHPSNRVLGEAEQDIWNETE